MNNETTLKDKWVVIPGFSSGTGEAITKALVRDYGLNVVGIHRGSYKEQADTLEKYILDNGSKCENVISDAAEPENIDTLTNLIKEKIGSENIHMFVHSIANGSYGRFVSKTGDQLHFKQINKTMQAMAHSFVYWAQHLYHKELLAPGARIVGLTNSIPESIVNGLGAITAAKATLEVYTKHLALDLGPEGFRVNLVKFSLVETEAIRIAFTEEQWNGLKKRLSRVTPAGRLCHVKEVANFVSVLAGPNAEWFNGATIDFTGGQAQSIQNSVYNPRQGELDVGLKKNK
ncbi:MAG: SDR family oxidoreductase [bacterium]|nr:SDR family oxidoreductase [bacterium]MBU1918971.1 SDR family oxidoreductase [bacterium]